MDKDMRNNILWMTIPRPNFDINILNIGPGLIENVDYKATKEYTPLENESKFRIEMISEKGKKHLHG